MTFREKLAEAMVGHTMEEITSTLIDALGSVIAEADPAWRDRMVVAACAEVVRQVSANADPSNAKH